MAVTYIDPDTGRLRCAGCQQKAISEDDDYHDVCEKRVDARPLCARSDEEILLEAGRRGLGWKLIGTSVKMVRLSSPDDLMLIVVPCAATPQTLKALAECFQGIDMDGQKALIMTDEITLDVADVEVMREMGWVRANA